MVPVFQNERDRHNWIIEHADYFTVVRFKNRHYERFEAKSLPEAQRVAKTLQAAFPEKPWMIYAVAGASDTLVEVVQ